MLETWSGVPFTVTLCPLATPHYKHPPGCRPLGNVGRMTQPFLIGVAGGSSSGKTTVANRIAEYSGAEAVSVIQLDSYYRDFPDEPLDVRRAMNYDHPDAFDWELLNQHVDLLARGTPVTVPIYDYAAYGRTGEVQVVEPTPIVVVEGILVLWEAQLWPRFDLRIFIDAPADIRLVRRIQRDVLERGRTVTSILDQYLDTVRPAHEQFVEPSKRHADVIFPDGGRNERAMEVILARVRELSDPARRPVGGATS